MVFGPGSNFQRKIGQNPRPEPPSGGSMGAFFGAYLICSRWSVCERGHQQNTPLRSRQEAGGNGIIMIVTAGNGQARHKRRTLQLSVQAKGGCGEFPVAGDRRFPKPRMTCVPTFLRRPLPFSSSSNFRRLRRFGLFINAAIVMRLLASTAAPTHSSNPSRPFARHRFIPRPRNNTEMRPSIPARNRCPSLKASSAPVADRAV